MTSDPHLIVMFHPLKLKAAHFAEDPAMDPAVGSGFKLHPKNQQDQATFECFHRRSCGCW